MCGLFLYWALEEVVVGLDWVKVSPGIGRIARDQTRDAEVDALVDGDLRGGVFSDGEYGEVKVGGGTERLAEDAGAGCAPSGPQSVARVSSMSRRRPSRPMNGVGASSSR